MTLLLRQKAIKSLEFVTLFVEYLNDNIDTEYKLKPLLAIIDEILEEFYQHSYWGYSLPNYLSAAHNTHPNYAEYLNDRHTLTVEEMNDIFDMMDDDKRFYYDKNYIEDLYIRYLSLDKVQENRREELAKKLARKKILLIAPGKSSVDEKDKLIEFATHNDVVVVSVNYDYPYVSTDYIFISNLRRFRELDKDKRSKCIVTSNISGDKIYLQTDYSELLNGSEMVQDNAGLMAIRFFQLCGVKSIYVAGMDGYSHETKSNFGDSRMAFIAKNAVLDEMNIGISMVLGEYSKEVDIQFLTRKKYVTKGVLKDTMDSNDIEKDIGAILND